jgi:Asp-tRNA(Asn)/Glu-tRNA(Gln) amidotransferase A subunit family amidase
MLDVLRTVDLLATPTSPKPAPTFATAYDSRWASRGVTCRLQPEGLPALALPCGFTTEAADLASAGRPAVRRDGSARGHAYEQATAHRRIP